jgi:hypothetical protein
MASHSDTESSVVQLLDKLEYHLLTNDMSDVLKPFGYMLVGYLVALVGSYLLVVSEVISMRYFGLVVEVPVVLSSVLFSSSVVFVSVVAGVYSVLFVYEYYVPFTGYWVSRKWLVGLYGVVVVCVVWIGLVVGVVAGLVSFSGWMWVLYLCTVTEGWLVGRLADAKATSVIVDDCRREEISYTDAFMMERRIEGFYPNVWRYLARLAVVLNVGLVLYLVVTADISPTVRLLNHLPFFILPSIIAIAFLVRSQISIRNTGDQE